MIKKRLRDKEVLEYVKKDYRTTSEIYEDVKKAGIYDNRISVYKSLTRLEQLNLIEKISVGADIWRLKRTG